MRQPRPIILIVSLVANAVCLWVWSRTEARPSQDAANLAPAVIAGRPSATMPSSRAITRAPLWRESLSTDLDRLKERLLAAGCPQTEIATILGKLIREPMDSFSEKQYSKRTYWSEKPGFSDPENNKQMSHLWLDQQKLIAKHLLTSELFPHSEELVEGLQKRYGDFPLEKLRAIAVHESDHNIKLSENYLTNPTQALAQGEDQRALSEANYAKMQSENEAFLKSVLTPEEYKTYELRGSMLAGEQRYRLNAFRPDEEEYKIVMTLEAQLHAARKNPNLTAEERQRLRPETDAAVAAQLGAERGADYLALRKYNGQPIVYLMARLNLPLATITAVDAVRAHSLAQVKNIQTNPQLSNAERTAQLAALSRETQSQLTLTLGERGVNAYREISGDWLENLEKPAPSGP